VKSGSGFPATMIAAGCRSHRRPEKRFSTSTHGPLQSSKGSGTGLRGCGHLDHQFFFFIHLSGNPVMLMLPPDATRRRSRPCGSSWGSTTLCTCSTAFCQPGGKGRPRGFPGPSRARDQPHPRTIAGEPGACRSGHAHRPGRVHPSGDSISGQARVGLGCRSMLGRFSGFPCPIFGWVSC